MEPVAMRQHHSILCARTIVFAAAIASLSVSAFGQTGQLLDVAAAVQAATAQTAGPVRRLTADDAVTLALEQNLGIQIARVNPQIQDLAVAQARSFWAPAFTSNLSRQRVTTPSTSLLSGGTNQDATFASSVGVNQELPWGGSYTASWGTNRLTTT